MTKRAAVVLWLAVTIVLFVVPIQGPTIKIYSDSNADGSGKEVFVALLGLLSLTSLIVGLVVLTVAWARGRRAKKALAV